MYAAINHMEKGGIYKIINKINGHYYVGQAICFKKRWQAHLRDLRNNRHSNERLQRAWNKYGADNFEFVIVFELTICDIDSLNECEQKYLDIAVNEQEKSYNLCFESKGGKFSEESIEKIRQSKLGNKNPMYGLFGKKHPLYGKILSEEHKKKVSEKNILFYSDPTNNPMYGKHHTDSTKKLISLNCIGKTTGNKNGRWKNVDDHIKNEIIQHSKISYSSAIKFAKLHNLGYRVVDRILNDSSS